MLNPSVMLARLGRHARLLVTIAFVLLSITALVMRPTVHWSPDGDAKYLQMMSIRFDGGHIRENVPYVGKPYDPKMAAVPLYWRYFDDRGGEIRLSWPVLFVLLSRPLHAVLGWFGLFLIPLAGGAASVHLTGVIAERIRKGTGWLASLVLAATTPVIVYSTLFWEHTPALALALCAVLLLVEFFRDGRRWRLVAAAALMGFVSAALRGEMNLLTAALFGGGFFATRGRARWWVPPLAIAGFVVGSAPGWALNYVVNGRILPSNVVKSVPHASVSYVNLSMLPNFFVGKLATTLNPTPAWITVLAPVVMCAAYYLRRRPGDERWRAGVLVAAASLLGMASLAVLPPTDRFHGWLAMCPALALGLLFPRTPLPEASAKARRMLLYAALLYAAIVAVVLGVLDPEEVDLEWGPRYWIAIFPLTTILLAVNHEAFADAVRPLLGVRAVLLPGALFLVGVTFIAVGMHHIHIELNAHRAEMRYALKTNGPEPLLTDVFWISPMDFDNFSVRPSFLVSFEKPEGFGPWLCEASAHGLTDFDLVTCVDEPREHPFFAVDPECNLHVVKEQTRTTGTFKFVRLRIAPGREQRKDQRLFGTHRLYGLIYTKYASMGEETSYLGLPRSDETSTTVFCRGGRYVQFEHGRIDFCAGVGAWAHDDPAQGYPGRDR